MKHTPLEILVIVLVLPFVILQIALPAAARRRHQDVNHAYPAFRFLYPVILAGIAALELLDPPLFGASRILNGIIMGICLYSTASPWWKAYRREDPQPYRSYLIVLTALYALFAVVFAVLTFR